VSQDGSITKWIGELKAGDDEAARQIWQRYCQRLIELAHQNLRSSSRRVADEEDAVICAFHSFCRRARDGRFPDLQDRDDLWHLLVRITTRKALNQATFLQRQKRGGGNVRGDSAFEELNSNGQAEGIAAIVSKEPTPELAATVAEEIQRLLDDLGNERLHQIACWKLEGYTHAEVGEKLNCSTRTVARKLDLIRAKFQLQEDE
jgi:DNA-directed RNA polymerase specialized sigma24 family protein